MKLYLIAGERSGDLHAGNLIKSLKRIDNTLQFKGFGGDYMRDAGMELTSHYSEMAFMGFSEVLANLNKISRKLKQCKSDILTFNPTAVILIDYAGFNLRIAKFAKENNIKVCWYISPKVWAWNQKRARKLKRLVDKMFVILPFEKEFFKRYEWDVDYVGNPVLDAVKNYQVDDSFLSRNDFKSKEIVALLPGSRKQELKRIIPLMADVAERNAEIEFGVAAVDNLDEDLYSQLKRLPNVKFVFGETYDLLNSASAAIVTSGTATLETGLWRVPQVVVYKLSSIEYAILKRLVKVPFISLVNLIANREVVKELIHTEANAESVIKELKLLLTDKSHRNKIFSGYEEIYNELDIGSASENTATKIMEYLKS